MKAFDNLKQSVKEWKNRFFNPTTKKLELVIAKPADEVKMTPYNPFYHQEPAKEKVPRIFKSQLEANYRKERKLKNKVQRISRKINRTK